MREFTPEEKRAEALREVAMRRRVYPRWVADGRMRQEEADRKIAIMEAMAEDYAPADLFSVARS